jgi:hypothetical protein
MYSRRKKNSVLQWSELPRSSFASVLPMAAAVHLPHGGC